MGLEPLDPRPETAKNPGIQSLWGRQNQIQIEPFNCKEFDYNKVATIPITDGIE